MKQKIEQMAKGMLEYQLPKLQLSEEKLELYVIAGGKYEGNFTIRNAKGSRMKGVLYSSSRLFVLSENKFVSEEITVSYTIDAKHLEPDENFEGEITIVTECGQEKLLFTVTVIPPYLDSSLGPVRSLNEFANLAKENFEEAKQLFVSEGFGNLLAKKNEKLYKIYCQLCKDSNTGHALDEFLISIRKKKPCSFTLNKDHLEYTAGEYSFLDKLVIQKNGWGYLSLRLSGDCPFLQFRHEQLTADDFHGASIEEAFVIDPSQLHAGVNLGMVTIESDSQLVSIPVCCFYHAKKDNPNRKAKATFLKFVQNHLAFCLQKIPTASYIKEAKKLLFGYQPSNEEHALYFELYKVYLLWLEKKELQALAALTDLENLHTEALSAPILSAMILYLSALFRGQTKEGLSGLNDLAKKYPKQGLILWFFYSLDREADPKRMLEDLELAYSQGVYSPFLFLLGFEAYQKNQEELSELTPFSVQTLFFAKKQGLMTLPLAKRVAYLATRQKKLPPSVLRLLTYLYEEFVERDILEAICQLLLSMEARAEAFVTSRFFWYMLGVREELTLPGLFEQYLSLAPDDKDMLLEHSALHFFSYQNSLGEEKKSFLYANLLLHKKTYGKLYEPYDEQIRKFTINQLAKGSIDRNLAILYDTIIPDLAMTPELSDDIPTIAFFYEIVCDNPKMQQVLVVHKEMAKEVSTPLIDGRALIELYTENAEVFLLDCEGHRFLSDVDYGINKLVHLESLLEECYKNGCTNQKLLLHLLERAQYRGREIEEDIEIRTRLLASSEITPDFLQECLRALLTYHYEHSDFDALEGYLSQINLELLPQTERNHIIEFMIRGDYYNIALRAIDEYGFWGIEIKRLARLCSRLLTNADGMEKVEILLALCFHVFEAGKQDEVILRYLSDYFIGTTTQMYSIWKAARELGLDSSDLEERLLGQILFAENPMPEAKLVFRHYYQTGTNQTLIRAFLSYHAYQYLVKDESLETELLDIMRKELTEEDNEICLLAVLRWYSTLEILTDSQVTFVDLHLHRFEQKGMILPFFRNFRDNMQVPQDLYDKYYVEHRTSPKKRVKIRYMVGQGFGETGFVEEEMTNVCYGIFVKEFVLFHNETLQYSIVEEDEEGSQTTEQVKLHLPLEVTQGEVSKYSQLNEILVARDLKDEATAMKLLDQYIRTDYAIAQLFRPL